MSTVSLAGARVLVAGASSGIGRAFAVGAVKDGARVVMAARRREHLEKARAEAGGGLCVTVDLTERDSGTRLAEAVGAHLGGLDLLFSSVGAAPLRMLADTADEDWRQVFETNVIGTHRVVRACLPLLERDAMILALSSESVSQPRTGLGAYGASKAALNRMISVWRAEHPELRFTTVEVGATFPTDFGAAFDAELLTRLMTDWGARGLDQKEYMTPENVAAVLLGTAATAWRVRGVCVEHLTVRSPSPVAGTSAHTPASYERAVSTATRGATDA
jgi:NAD(P)-dependent dehydrogenase (short-subunit alcohol dehydrogenase family)